MLNLINAVDLFNKTLDWNAGLVKTILIILQVIAAILLIRLIVYIVKVAKRKPAEKTRTRVCSNLSPALSIR